MPDIAPLVTCRADNQQLFALNAASGGGNLQNFTAAPVTLSGVFTVNTTGGRNIGQIAVPFDFTNNPSLPFYNLFASLSYTCDITSAATLEWVLILNGSILQTITQTPSTSAQTVSFNPYIAVGPELTGTGTTNAQVSVAWNGTIGSTVTLTSTTVKPLTCVVQGCKSI